MQSKENNYAFVDSQNLNLSIRALGWKIDFGRFRVYLKEKYQIKKAFLFIGISKVTIIYTSSFRNLDIFSFSNQPYDTSQERLRETLMQNLFFMR